MSPYYLNCKRTAAAMSTARPRSHRRSYSLLLPPSRQVYVDKQSSLDEKFCAVVASQGPGWRPKRRTSTIESAHSQIVFLNAVDATLAHSDQQTI